MVAFGSTMRCSLVIRQLPFVDVTLKTDAKAPGYASPMGRGVWDAVPVRRLHVIEEHQEAATGS